MDRSGPGLETLPETLPEGKQLVALKWIYKEKGIAKGEKVKYKAHLVTKGFTQRDKNDYDEVFT